MPVTKRVTRVGLPSRTRRKLDKMTITINAAWEHVMSVHAKLGVEEQARNDARQLEERCADQEQATLLGLEETMS